MPGYVLHGAPTAGTTAQRPTNVESGFRYFDTDIAAEVTWNGTAWVNEGLSGAAGASTAAAGSTTADAGVLPAGTSRVYPTTAADGIKGVRVNAADKITGRTILIGNGASAAVLKVYPPSGGTVNGAAADAAFSSVSGKGVIMHCLNAAANTWLAW